MKITYRKPKLELYTPNRRLLNTLTNKTQNSAYGIKLRQKINEVSELNFLMPFNNTKLNIYDCEKMVKLGFDYYVIKEISVDDSDKATINVRAVHEAVELKGIMCSEINLISVTAREMFNAIISSTRIALDGYIWLGTDIDNSIKRHLEGNSEKSVFENLIAMAENFGGWLEFSTDSNGRIGIFLRKNALDRGKFVKKGRDLKSINITYNTDEIFPIITPFGATNEDTGEEINIMSINNGIPYLENYDYYLALGMTMEEIKKSPKCQQECIYRNNAIYTPQELKEIALRELEICSKPKLTGDLSMVDLSVKEGSTLLAPIIGEKIIAIDKDIKFNIETTIVGVERDFDNPLNTTIEISNVIEYNSIFKDLVAKGEVLDKITNGGSSNPTVAGNYIQGLIDGNIAQIVTQLNNLGEIRDTTILFECRIVGHELFGAVAIGSRGLLCSTKLDSKNQWVWTTAISASGISADAIIALTVHAEQIVGGMLKSINNKSWLNLNNGTFNFGDKIKFDGTNFSINGYVTIGDLNSKGYVSGSQLATSGHTTINGGNVTTGVLQSQNGVTRINLNNGTFKFGNKIDFNGSQLTLNDVDVINIKNGNMNGNRLKSYDFLEVRPQVKNGRTVSMILPSAFQGKAINSDFKVICTYGEIDSDVGNASPLCRVICI